MFFDDFCPWRCKNVVKRHKHGAKYSVFGCFWPKIFDLEQQQQQQQQQQQGQQEEEHITPCNLGAGGPCRGAAWIPLLLRHVQICNDVQTRFIQTCSGDQRSGTKLCRMHWYWYSFSYLIENLRKVPFSTNWQTAAGNGKATCKVSTCQWHQPSSLPLVRKGFETSIKYMPRTPMHKDSARKTKLLIGKELYKCKGKGKESHSPPNENRHQQ